MLTIAIAFLTVLEVITALLLIGIILIQQSKSGGGLGAVGGGITETVFGASAGNVLTKGTVILAAIFLTATLLLAVLTGHRRPGQSVVQNSVVTSKSEPSTASAPGSEAPRSSAAVEAAKPAPKPAAGAMAGPAPEPKTSGASKNEPAKPTAAAAKPEKPTPAK